MIKIILKTFILYMISGLVLASPIEVVEFSLNGHPYKATLSENTELTAKLGQQEKPSRATHYFGKLNDDSNSWLRVSKINGEWQGIISAFDALYIISPDLESQHNTPNYSAKHPNAYRADSQQIFAGKSCATNSSLHSKKNELTNLPAPRRQKAAVPFPTLCAATINGKCILADMEFAFDKLFKNRFPSGDFKEQAISLINMTEGYYINDLQIGFENISINHINDDETLADNIFTNSTDIDILLNQIQTKKGANTISFLKSRNAIFHFVSGRPFDNGKIGIAHNNGLCDLPSSGKNTSVTQFYTNIPTTALVVAHELAHNFGAILHDNQTGSSCPVTNTIMSLIFNPAATRFSSCSIQDIENHIASLEAPAQCLNFSVDMSIRDDANNPMTPPFDVLFTYLYDIATIEGYGKIQGATLTGKFTEPGSQFHNVSLGGNNCTISGPDDTNYSCTITGNVPSSQILAIDISSKRGTATLEQKITVTLPDSVIDTDLENNTFTQVIIMEEATPPGSTNLSALAFSKDIRLSWNDNAYNEDEFRVERRLLSETIWTELDLIPADRTSYTDTSTLPNQDYVYRVFAFNSYSDSLPSNEASVKFPNPAAKIAEKREGKLPAIVLLLLFALVAKKLRTISNN